MMVDQAPAPSMRRTGRISGVQKTGEKDRKRARLMSIVRGFMGGASVS